MSITTLLKLSIPLFLVHAVEEYSTGILNLDPLFRWVTAQGLPTVSLYIAEQFGLVVLLLLAIYYPWFWLRVFIGLLFILEITHIIPALQQMSYYPGLVTGALLVVFGIFYWDRLMRMM